MQYQEAVAEARTLVKRSEDDQWRLAELTFEQIRDAGVSQNQWARDVGIHRNEARRLFLIGQRWSGSSRNSRPTYNEAYMMVREGVDDPEEAREVSYQRQAIGRIRNLPPEQKAAVVREALDEPDVAVRVLRDPHTRRNVTEAREQVANEIESTARERTDADPQSRAIREASLTINIESNISKARFWLAEATRQLQDLEDRDPAVMERLARDVDEVDLALGWLRTALEGGRVSDEDLARLLEGGA